MAIFVLVHGAFQGGWVWKDTASSLRKMGHEVHTPTLTGCGYLSPGLAQGQDLGTYARDVSGYLHMEDLSDVVLVGHSYSGMVCGAVAVRAPKALGRLVFVDAAIPESGRSFADLGGEMFKQMLDKHTVDGWKVKPWPLPVFGVPEEAAGRVGPRLREFPLAAFTTPLEDGFDPQNLDAAHISCLKTKNPFIRAMADKARRFGWPVYGLDTDHSPMSSHPVELAALLHEIGGKGAA